MFVSSLYPIILFITWTEAVLQCNDTRQGERILHRNRVGNDVLLICVKENKIYRWKFVDGSSTYGETFDPAKGCSDIVDNLPKAEDGFYWILFNKKNLQKVWCDVHTDGGGFMLVGKKDSPETWTVPSNSTPVHPRGPAHWSSVLGDVKVQEFRIQVSTNKRFDGTKAHWLYHLNQKRQLGRIFSVNKGGCPSTQPGISNVAYVKNILTGSVVTTTFRCSKFGPHTHPKLGWGRMNYCLKHACPRGYAFFPGYGILDKFGSFSYSALSEASGVGHNSTAFVGCDHGKCCACFGPKRGRKNFCGPKCTAINGGTVVKQASVWFWIRTRLPRRVWKRCMEYKRKTMNGKFETYFIDPSTGTPHKGTCSQQFKTLLNEGTLVVADKSTLQSVPPVPGLLSYRQDNKQLYVNEGSQWKALSTENEIKQLRAKTRTLEYELYRLKRILEGPISCTALRGINASLPSGFYYINPQGVGSSTFRIYCDMTSKNGVGVTVVGHDSEAVMKVDGYDSPGSYSRKVKYVVKMEQIAAIVKVSTRCEQFVRYQCHDSGLWLDQSYAWWVSRQGARMKYWGGAAVNSEKCACGMTNSCTGGGACNCDKNDGVLREDSGFLTDKNTLPVTELRFGDTGTRNGHNEYGYHTLGKLRCWG